MTKTSNIFETENKATAVFFSSLIYYSAEPKVGNRNTSASFESKVKSKVNLKVKTSERHQWHRSDVFLAY